MHLLKHVPARHGGKGCCGLLCEGCLRRGASGEASSGENHTLVIFLFCNVLCLTDVRGSRCVCLRRCGSARALTTTRWGATARIACAG